MVYPGARQLQPSWLFCGSCRSGPRIWVSLMAWSGPHSNSAYGQPHDTIHSVQGELPPITCLHPPVWPTDRHTLNQMSWWGGGVEVGKASQGSSQLPGP